MTRAERNILYLEEKREMSDNKPRRKASKEAEGQQNPKKFTQVTYYQVAFQCNTDQETVLLEKGDSMGIGEWIATGQPVDISFISHPIVPNNRSNPEEILDMYLNKEGVTALVFVREINERRNTVGRTRTVKVSKS